MNAQPNQLKPDRTPIEFWTPWGSVPRLGAWKKRALPAPVANAKPRLPTLVVKPAR